MRRLRGVLQSCVLLLGLAGVRGGGGGGETGAERCYTLEDCVHEPLRNWFSEPLRDLSQTLDETLEGTLEEVLKVSLEESPEESLYESLELRCVMKRVTATSPCSLSSSLEVHHQDMIPGSHAWARCKQCFYHDGKFQAVEVTDTHTTENNEIIDVSWSHWGEFFHHKGHADRLQAEILSFSSEDVEAGRVSELFEGVYVIEHPVFYIPVIAFHYGHILIDVVEQLYGAMMDTYGNVRRDAIILLDSSNQSEREMLPKILHKFCNTIEKVDHFCNLLRWLTDMPIISAHNILKDRRFFFQDLHLGSYLTHSFFSDGVMRQPCHFVTSDPYVQYLSSNYMHFRDYLWTQCIPDKWLNVKNDEMTHDYPAAVLDVVFVQRSGSREIINVKDLLAITEVLSLSADVITFDNVPFSKQLEYLYFSDCIVAAAGTATHNMLFMRPGSTMIILMQSEWCAWSWMYVNQGKLLGINVHVICDQSDGSISPLPHTRHSSFVNKFWKQGPGGSKNSNVSVNLGSFEEYLMDISSAGKQTFGNHFGDYESHSWCLGSNEKSALTFKLSESLVKDPVLYSLDASAPSRVGNIGGENIINRPFIRASVVRITLSDTIHPHSTPNNPMWLKTIALQADITSKMNDFPHIFEYFPHLTMCSMIFILPEEEASGPFCVRSDALNFHSTINTHLHPTQEELVIHVWYQISENGGKFEGSDCYVPLFLNMPNVGLQFPTTVDFPDTLFECFVDAITGRNAANIQNSHVFSFSPTYRNSLQHAIADFCRIHKMRDNLCYRAAYTITQCFRKTVVGKGLPTIQELPTAQNPFVFLHFEKVGGTSLRELIHRSAVANDLQYFIPAYNSVPDMTFSLPITPSASGIPELDSYWNTSVLAGHFEWGVWDNLPNFSRLKTRLVYKESHHIKGERDVSSIPRIPPCFMMGRHPVDRVISYYYQRCYREKSCRLYQVRFGDLSVEDMYYIVVLFRQAKYLEDGSTLMFSDDGTHDSMCRAALGERVTTGRLVRDLVGSDGSVPNPGDVDESKHDEAISNSNHCVIGMLEQWELSTIMMKYWFPWMSIREPHLKNKTNNSSAENDASNTPHLMKLYKGKENIATIGQDIRNIIESLIPCDMKLYNNMLLRFERQKQHLMSEGLL